MELSHTDMMGKHMVWMWDLPTPGAMKNTVCYDVMLYSLVYTATNFCQITWCHIPENNTVYLFIVCYILMNTINLFSPPKPHLSSQLSLPYSW